MTSVPSLNSIEWKLAKLAHFWIFDWLAGWAGLRGQNWKPNCDSKQNVMTSHYAKFQLDSSKRSQVIPLWKSTQRRQQRRQRRRRHPPGLNYSPRRKVFRRGQKYLTFNWTHQTKLQDDSIKQQEENSSPNKTMCSIIKIFICMSEISILQTHMFFCIS